MDDKIIELENRISKLEQINKRRKIVKIVTWIIAILIFIGISILYYFYFKNFASSLDSLL